MQDLRAASPETLVIVHDGARTTLTGITWGEAYEMYPGHWLVHLEWTGESQYGMTNHQREMLAEQRRRQEEFRNCDAVKVAQIREEIRQKLANGEY